MFVDLPTPKLRNKNAGIVDVNARSRLSKTFKVVVRAEKAIRTYPNFSNAPLCSYY